MRKKNNILIKSHPVYSGIESLTAPTDVQSRRFTNVRLNLLELAYVISR